ncbi:Ig-like domain-containing protein [Syntrophomonas erecta subsp. sporosyntropha]
MISYQRKFAYIAMLAFMMTIIFFSPHTAYAKSVTIKDIQGHWAEQTIQNMVDNGIVAGNPDGTFKPEGKITRAEFATLLVKAYKLSGSGKVFADTSSHWAKDYIAIASANSIVNGYNDGEFGPNDLITREQTAVMIVKAAQLEPSNATLSFADSAKISTWASNAVAAAYANQIIKGLPDGRFAPQDNATRAQAVVVINAALNARVTPSVAVEPEQDYSLIEKAGSYGPAAGSQTINGNVTVKAKDVTLENLRIKGDLIIAEEVGDGDVILNKVMVEGKTYIRGGGQDSIYINGGKHSEIIVEKTAGGQVRIVVVDVQGIKVTIAENAENEKVMLQGQFKSVTIKADDVKITTQEDTGIDEVKVQKGLKGINVELAKGSSVKGMILDSKTTIKGEGTIKEASGEKVKETTFQKQPDKIVTKSSGGRGGGGPATPSTTAEVSSVDALNKALNDSNIKTINFTNNIKANVEIKRLPNTINFGSYALDGDLKITTNDKGTMILSGNTSPCIKGNLTVNAPNATIANKIKVGGIINIVAVAPNSWNEEADGNSLNIQAENASINITGQVNTLVVNVSVRVNVAGTGNVTEVTFNASAEITGGGSIESAVINVTGVKIDIAPQQTTLGEGTTVEIGGSQRDTAWIDTQNAINALSKQIQKADDLFASTPEGDQPGQASQTARLDFKTAINAAKAVNSNSNSSAEEIKAATNALTTATAAFEAVLVKEVPVIGVFIDQTSIGLEVGQSENLIAIVQPENASNKAVAWSSSNPEIATVDNTGKVTGFKAGTTTIAATTADGNKTADCLVTVVDISILAITGVAIIPDIINIEKGTSIEALGLPTQIEVMITGGEKRTVDVTWNDGIPQYNPNQVGDYTFYGTLTNLPTGVTNPSHHKATVKVIVIASLEDNTPPVMTRLGNETVILNVGETYIEPGVTAIDDNDGDITSNIVRTIVIDATGSNRDEVDTSEGCSYTIHYNIMDFFGNTAEVTRKVIVIEKVREITVSSQDGITTILKSQTLQMQATITRDTATNKEVTWSVEPGTGTATIDNDGLLTATGAGTVTVKATAKDGSGIVGEIGITIKESSIPVTDVFMGVSSEYIEVGKDVTLLAIVQPENASNKAVTWSSSNTEIATVDSTGKVTGLKAGIATIMVTTADGNKSATCEVMVEDPTVHDASLASFKVADRNVLDLPNIEVNDPENDAGATLENNFANRFGISARADLDGTTVTIIVNNEVVADPANYGVNAGDVIVVTLNVQGIVTKYYKVTVAAVQGPEPPAAPEASAVTITQPIENAAIGQTNITIATNLEFRITDAAGIEKQGWTDGTGEALATTANPALAAGDKLEVRVKEALPVLAGDIYTYIVQTDDIGTGNEKAGAALAAVEAAEQAVAAFTEGVYSETDLENAGDLRYAALGKINLLDDGDLKTALMARHNKVSEILRIYNELLDEYDGLVAKYTKFQNLTTNEVLIKKYTIGSGGSLRTVFTWESTNSELTEITERGDNEYNLVIYRPDNTAGDAVTALDLTITLTSYELQSTYILKKSFPITIAAFTEAEQAVIDAAWKKVNDAIADFNVAFTDDMYDSTAAKNLYATALEPALDAISAVFDSNVGWYGNIDLLDEALIPIRSLLDAMESIILDIEGDGTEDEPGISPISDEYIWLTQTGYDTIPSNVITAWTSSHSDIVSTDGQVTRPVGADVDITLSLTLTADEYILQNEFTVTVLAIDPRDAALEELIIGGVTAEDMAGAENNGKVLVKWTPLTGAQIEETGALGYTVFYNDGIDSYGSIDVEDPRADKLEVTDLIADREYSFWIISYNETCESAWIEEAQAQATPFDELIEP